MEAPFTTHVPENVSDVSTVPVEVTTRAVMTSVYEPEAVPEIVMVAPRIVVGSPLGE
jgi:hypothetical protein